MRYAAVIFDERRPLDDRLRRVLRDVLQAASAEIPPTRERNSGDRARAAESPATGRSGDATTLASRAADADARPS